MKYQHELVKVLFFGSPAFAVPTLDSLARHGYRLRVITRPDRPVGRKQNLTPCAVKVAAQKLGLVFEQPEKLDDNFIERQRQWRPDVAILAAYGKIIKPDLLKVPRKGFLNIHPSLLPRHRGASPVAGAILSGDKKTGVTIMQMDEDLDTGPILTQECTALRGDETCGMLTAKLAIIGAQLLTTTLETFLKKQMIPVPQNNAEAMMTHILKKNTGKIVWSKPVEEIERMVRAYNPWPSAWTTIDGQRYKILQASVGTTSEKPVGIIIDSDETLGIVCGNGRYLRLTTVQQEGGKPTDGRSFYHGHQSLINHTAGT